MQVNGRLRIHPRKYKGDREVLTSRSPMIFNSYSLKLSRKNFWMPVIGT